jgi:hypothetical protein
MIWFLPAPVWPDSRLAILLDNQAAKAPGFDRAIVMAGISAIGKERNQFFGPGIDAAVRISGRNIDSLTRFENLRTPVALRRLEQHDPLPGQAIIDLCRLQNAVKMALGHEIFIADFPWKNNACAKAKVSIADWCA